MTVSALRASIAAVLVVMCSAAVALVVGGIVRALASR